MHLREMDANLLVVLDAMLVEASVTKAADRLGRSPSAVSHALANLRYVFSDELFVRAGQRLVPTARAQEIAPTVHVIVSGMESLLRPTNPFEPLKETRDFVFIGPEAFELTLLDKVKASLASTAPGITLGWRSLNGLDPLQALRANEAQFVIAEDAREAANSEIVWQHLFDEPFVALANEDVASRVDGTISGFDQKLECIVVSRNAETEKSQSGIFQWLSDCGHKVRTTKSVFGALFQASEKNLVVIAPSSAARRFARQLNLHSVDLGFGGDPVRIYLGWHRSFDRDECHSWLRENVTRAASALAETLKGGTQ